MAGAASRAVAGFATAPLELARVRLQAADHIPGSSGGGGSGGGIMKQLTSPPGASRLQRVTSMWTGAYQICTASGGLPRGAATSSELGRAAPGFSSSPESSGEFTSHTACASSVTRSRPSVCVPIMNLARCCRPAGMGASLAKDVPFAALYWTLLEPLRGTLMRHDYRCTLEVLELDSLCSAVLSTAGAA